MLENAFSIAMLSCRLPVACLSLSCRLPVACLPLSCRLPVATLSSSCRHPVAFLSLPAAFHRRLPRVARIYSGEKFSNAELKNLIFDKIPYETAATLRNKQSEEKVKTWWAEVDGFDASASKFSVRKAVQKCSPTWFSKVKFTEKHVRNGVS